MAPRQRHNWEHEALAYLGKYGVLDLSRYDAGARSTDVPGYRSGVLYQLEKRALVKSQGYGTFGYRWSITEAGLAEVNGERALRERQEDER